MIHPNTRVEFIRPETGHGVVATQDLPVGTLLWVKSDFDQILPPARRGALPEPMKKLAEAYGSINAEGGTLLCWDIARFCNHSCQPNSLLLGPSMEICVREIKAGEELTCDYGCYNREQDLVCKCGRAQCRGIIKRTDALKLGAAYVELVTHALQCARDVPQPLLCCLPDQRDWQGYLSAQLTVPRPESYFCELMPE